MDRIMKALRITGALGTICGVNGYIGFLSAVTLMPSSKARYPASYSAFRSSFCSLSPETIHSSSQFVDNR